MTGVVSGQGRRFVGHNPATSFTLLLMFAATLGLGWTGIQMGQGNEGVKDIHELLANGLLFLALVHVAGVLLHTVRHREAIVGGMIHGKKMADPVDSIPSSAPIAALAGLLITGFFAGSLLSNFDPQAQTTRIPVLGNLLSLGEGEEQERENEESDD
jgi:hypothetical protein